MGTISYTVPVAGTDTNFVAAPEVDTALSTLLTWANGDVDSTNISATAGILRSQQAGSFSNLVWTSASGATNAADGKFYKVTAAATVTLPTPAAGATIGIQNDITAGGTVTVTASSGVTFGVGLTSSGNATFLLGTLWASAVVISDGTNWYMVSGQQDTGWIALTLGSSMATNSGAFTPSVRMTGDRVFFKGTIAQSGGNAVTGLATLPTGITKPASNADMPCSAYNGSSYEGGVYGVNPSTGTVGWVHANGSGGLYFLDGLSYSLT